MGNDKYLVGFSAGHPGVYPRRANDLS